MKPPERSYIKIIAHRMHQLHYNYKFSIIKVHVTINWAHLDSYKKQVIGENLTS